MGLNAEDIGRLSQHLAGLKSLSEKTEIDLGVDYNPSDGAPVIAACINGEPIAYISRGGSGYEIIGMPT